MNHRPVEASEGKMAHVKSEQGSDSNVTEKGISDFVLRPGSLENVEAEAEAVELSNESSLIVSTDQSPTNPCSSSLILSEYPAYVSFQVGGSGLHSPTIIAEPFNYVPENTTPISHQSREHLLSGHNYTQGTQDSKPAYVFESPNGTTYWCPNVPAEASFLQCVLRNDILELITECVDVLRCDTEGLKSFAQKIRQLKSEVLTKVSTAGDGKNPNREAIEELL
ncbi:hypothetical protein L1987_21164 [Smallanthus sonchifolius]|uniref:Uncharacterized protein n=1 Tax=Smallanthus sonchifolius TaxID=185202 RepID=A0ACB9ITW7_9ASTR|nr:hypothetical protein L1987_21164 [Smallanthus sonchifolius]